MEYVVLLHGLASTRLIMAKIGHALKKDGYEVLNIGYPSRKNTLEKLADYLNKELSSQLVSKKFDPKINFVTHSLGGVVAKSFLKKYKPKNIKRMVMLAPPNKVSKSAKFWAQFKTTKKLFGPTLKELTIKSTFGPIQHNVEIGIIAGSRDKRLSIEETKLAQAKDFAIVNSGHTTIINKSETLELIRKFLKNGSFK